MCSLHGQTVPACELQGKVAEDHWELRLELWARAICLNAILRLYPEVHREPHVSQGRSSFQEATWMEEDLDLEKIQSHGDRQVTITIVQARDDDPDEDSDKGSGGELLFSGNVWRTW